MAKRKQWRRRNGSGSVVDTKRTDIRTPFMVRVNTGYKFDKNGKRVPIRKLLGYYETREQAEIALENYLVKAREEGQTFEKSKANKLKIQFIWDEFVKEQLTKGFSDSRNKAYGYTWNYIPDEIRALSFEETNYQIWRDLFDKVKAKTGYSTLKRIKGDMQQMYDYAKRYDVTVQNYPAMYSLGASPKKGQALVFSKDEIVKLWKLHEERQGNREAVFAVDTVLILIYCGCRIEELLSLENKHIHMSENWFEIVNPKTPAGFRRIPIHPSVHHIWQQYFDPENKYFLTMPMTNKKYTYENYRDSYWDRLRDKLEWNEHMTPHNARKTFSSYIMYYGVDRTCQKIMLGHSGRLDLQEEVYSKVPTSKLISELNRIPKDYNRLINLNDEYSL